MVVTGNKIIGPIGQKKPRGFRFLAANTRTSLGGNVMNHHPRLPGLPANRGPRRGSQPEFLHSFRCYSFFAAFLVALALGSTIGSCCSVAGS
jgi:hypothetical protein